MPKLIRPSSEYQDSFIGAVREFQAERLHLYTDLETADLETDFEAYVQRELDRAQVPLRPEWVPDTIFWLVNDIQKEFLGRISIRHQLAGTLREFGGHIGYEIRPSQRCKGYGTLLLRLALPEARRLGITKALITCDIDNVGSQKIIEANGGVLEDVIELDYRNVPTMRWWIDLNDLQTTD